MSQFDLGVVVCEARFPLHDLNWDGRGSGKTYVSDLACRRCGMKGDALARAWFRQQGRLEDRKRGLNV